MGWFSSKKENLSIVQPEASESAAVEARPERALKVREKRDYSALVSQRKEQSSAKWGPRFEKMRDGLKGLWEGSKKVAGGSRDLAISVPYRVVDRAGQAKDLGVIAAVRTGEAGKAAVHATAEAGRATGRAAKTAAEFGAGVAVAGVVGGIELGKAGYRKGVELKQAGVEKVQAAGRAVKETYEGAKQGTMEVGRGLVRVGREGAAAAMSAVERGWDNATTRFNETRTRISENARDRRGVIMNGVEMLKYKAETVKQNLLMAAIRKLEARIGLSQNAQDEIANRFQQRMEARGVDYQALGFEADESGSQEAVA